VASTWTVPVSRNALGSVLVVAILAVGCGEPYSSTLDVVPAVAAHAADISYSCDHGPSFTPALFDKPGDAEKLQTPVGRAFRDLLASGAAHGNLSGWHYLGEDGKTATFALRRASSAGIEDELIVAQVLNEGGRWYANGSETCSATAVLNGLQNADWVFDPTVAPPQATDHQFVALVTEDICASEETSRTPVLTSPAILYEQHRILVIFGLRPPPDAADIICEANRTPPARVLVLLRQPIGNRLVLDGGRYPPGDPTKPGP
jgi:hypothetical protein